MNKPLVSICIPTYNGAAFIREALTSALTQRYRPLEIIVSDDGSVDDTLQIVAQVECSSPVPIHILQHAGPGELGANWNNCARRAKGKYLKYLCQDDLLYPHCIAKMVALAESDPGIGMVFCPRIVIHDRENSDHVLWVKKYGHLNKGFSCLVSINRGSDLLGDPALLAGPLNKIGEPTALLIKRSSLLRLGGFNSRLRQIVDLEFSIRMMAIASIGFIDEQLVGFRLHPGQATIKNRKKVSEITAIELTLLRPRIFVRLHWRTQKRLVRNSVVRLLKRLIRPI